MKMLEKFCLLSPLKFSLLRFLPGAGIAQAVQRLATSWTTEVSEFEPRLGQEFSLLHVVQTGSGTHPASYPMGTGGFFLGVVWTGREADHSLPTSAEFRKTLIYTSTPPIRLHGVVLN
jgi:hypothetical protein